MEIQIIKGHGELKSHTRRQDGWKVYTIMAGRVCDRSARNWSLKSVAWFLFD